MNYIIIINDKDERMRVAAEIQKILKNCKTYIPGTRTGQVYRTDIGIKADVDKETLAHVDGLIQRRGYQVTKTGGPEDRATSLSSLNNTTLL